MGEPHSAHQHPSAKVPLHQSKAFRLVLLAKLLGVVVAVVVLHEVQVEFGTGIAGLALLHVALIGILVIYLSKAKKRRHQI